MPHISLEGLLPYPLQFIIQYHPNIHGSITRQCEAIGTAATPGLLCEPRVIVKMIVEKQMECRLAGETEVCVCVCVRLRPN
jgi:hypothetical protein